jgi:hypothetical protein
MARLPVEVIAVATISFAGRDMRLKTTDVDSTPRGSTSAIASPTRSPNPWASRCYSKGGDFAHTDIAIA